MFTTKLELFMILFFSFSVFHFNHGKSLGIIENERRIRANDREYNSQFRYAVS